MNDSRHALIIANNEYQNPGLKQLVSPAEDALALAGVLGDPKVGNFNVQVAANEPCYMIARWVDDFFADRRAGDELLLHFSCHGLKSESGELYFAATDTMPGRLISTAVAADFVRRCMLGCRARSIVLFLDCCYGGAFSHGMAMRAGEDVHVLDAFSGAERGGRGWAVITASNSMEYAFEGSRLSGEFDPPRPSVFTGALVNGLVTGEADRDEDGLVSLNELYDYVYERVLQENPHQTPSRTVNLQGDLYVARSRRKRIKPAGLSDDLREAISSPNVFTQRGAIAELRFRLTSTNLEVAAGAYEALTHMSHQGSQWAADEAKAALRDVSLSPDRTALDFGTLLQGAPTPHQEVLLTGIPLARHCEAVPADDRITVERTENGLDVSLDTSRTGRLSAGVTLKGVVGESTLHVDAEIAAKPEPRQREVQSERRHQTPAEAKRAVALAGFSLFTGFASTFFISLAIGAAQLGGSHIASETARGVTLPKAVEGITHFDAMGVHGLIAALAAIATLLLGRGARRAVAASGAATLNLGEAKKGVLRSASVMVILAQIALPLGVLFFVGSLFFSSLG
ncbi:caspase domain-containing protein [Streptomyces sp. NPDC127106]|uniref:caspase family protein n=1 Tax=Streptomyces sp. NPDC127106 TaxID=3345360 RepID=UPI00363B1B0A